MWRSEQEKWCTRLHNVFKGIKNKHYFRINVSHVVFCKSTEVSDWAFPLSSLSRRTNSGVFSEGEEWGGKVKGTGTCRHSKENRKLVVFTADLTPSINTVSSWSSDLWHAAHGGNDVLFKPRFSVTCSPLSIINIRKCPNKHPYICLKTVDKRRSV